MQGTQTDRVIEKEIRDNVANLLGVSVICNTPHLRCLLIVVVNESQIASPPTLVFYEERRDRWLKSWPYFAAGLNGSILEIIVVESMTRKGGYCGVHPILRVEHDRRYVSVESAIEGVSQMIHSRCS